MTEKEVIIDGVDISGCKFQTDCIEYKDISYLKIMPICAIHELSIACHDKVNKCKYYTLYTQLKQFETENAKLKEELNRYKEMEAKGLQEFKDIGGCWGCGIQLLLNNERVNFKKCDLENKKLKAKLEKIFEIVDENRITAQYKGICTSILMIIRGEEDE